MNKASNQPIRKVYFNKDYGLGIPTAEQDQPTAKFQRKKDSNARNDLLNRDRKRKIGQEPIQVPQMYYISPSSDHKSLNRMIRSSSANIMTFASKKSESKDQLLGTQKKFKMNQRKQNDLGSSEAMSRVDQQKKQRTKTMGDFGRISVVDMEQFRLQKINLQQEIRNLNQTIDKKNKLISQLQKSITQRDIKIAGYEKQIRELRSQETSLKTKIDEQCELITLYQQQEQKDKEDGKSSVETGEDLQKILSDINRNFSEMSLESKPGDQRDGWLEELVDKLQQKVKYQEIEITMLKKQKHDNKKSAIEIDALKSHNKTLSKKLKGLQQKMRQEERKKIAFDYEISLDLSRDDSQAVL